MANLLTQLEKAFESVTGKTCLGVIKKVRAVENKCWNEDLKKDVSCEYQVM